MLAPLRNYRVYRQRGMRNAWRYAGMNFLAREVLRWLGFAAFAVAVLYMISDKANALGEAADNRVAAKVANQAAYIKELEAVLKRCLAPGDNQIRIGDEIYFCGMTTTGIRK